MTTRADLERALATAGCSAPAFWDETTGSTNATARDLAESGAPEWTLAAAGHQTKGRGRLGRTWLDRPGRALLFSLVLRPRMDPGAAGLLPLLAGAAMAEAGGALAGAGVRCKWPNDLLVGEAKVGGILTEAQVTGDLLDYVVLGLGVNLEVPEGIVGAAGLGAVAPMDLLTAFLVAFREGYRPSEAGFSSEVVRRWTRISSTLGREVETARAQGPAVRGTAVSVDELGGLVIDTATGSVSVTSGEVVHLLPARRAETDPEHLR